MPLTRPFAAGRDADVYALDQARVLRRYRNGDAVAREAAVMHHVRTHGFPVPEIFSAEGPDLVMRRVDGPTMLSALLAETMTPELAGEMLADLHDRLHALPARSSPTSRASILHLDLHPANVLIGPDGPSVIDWRNTAEGDPNLDVALTALILGQVGRGKGARARAARLMLPVFLRSTSANPLAAMDQAVAMRNVDANLSQQELDLISAACTDVTHHAGR